MPRQGVVAKGESVLNRIASTADSEKVAPREGDPIPLSVDLAGDAKCATVSHDHDQHWAQKFSWYRCSDGPELLTDQDIGVTFDTGAEVWTAQRSVDEGKPQTVRVETAAYAGA